MILTDEQRMKALHGFVDTEIRDGYRFFYRFTKKQRDYYKETVFVTKERASSSQYMEFVTDATAVSFAYREEQASSQTFYFFDLYVNGEMAEHKGAESYTTPDEGVCTFDLPAGEKTVRIYFPNLSMTGLGKVELENATVFRTTEKKIQYVAYGDSITQGYTAFSPSLTYVNIVGSHLDADVYNMGIGGEFFQPLMVDEDYPVKGDIVTVAYGTNDWGHIEPEEDAVRRKGFFEALLKTHKGAKIFVLLPIWRGNGREDDVNGYGKLNDYRAMLREEMKQYPEITVIEGINLVPHHTDFYVADVLHPNALGFTQYGKNVWNELKKHL